MSRTSSSITTEQMVYGYDDSVRLHWSNLFFVKGGDGNKVVLNKIPPGVKSVEILDENSDALPILERIFTFKPHTKNVVLITTSSQDYRYFEYRPEKGGFIEKN